MFVFPRSLWSVKVHFNFIFIIFYNYFLLKLHTYMVPHSSTQTRGIPGPKLKNPQPRICTCHCVQPAACRVFANIRFPRVKDDRKRDLDFTLTLGISRRPLMFLDPGGKRCPLPRDHLTGALRSPSSLHWNTTSLPARCQNNNKTFIFLNYIFYWAYNKYISMPLYPKLKNDMRIVFISRLSCSTIY